MAGDDHPICPVMVGEAPLAVELASGMLSELLPTEDSSKGNFCPTH